MRGPKPRVLPLDDTPNWPSRAPGFERHVDNLVRLSPVLVINILLLNKFPSPANSTLIDLVATGHIVPELERLRMGPEPLQKER